MAPGRFYREGPWVQIVKNFDGDLGKLGEAELFFLYVSEQRHFNFRVDVLIAKEEIIPLVKGFSESISCLHQICRTLLECTSLKRFLLIIREVGNHMNKGTYAGNAAGFRLSSLSQLWEMKSNKPRVTFLHAIIDIAENATLDSIGFLNDLTDLQRLSRISLDNIRTESQQTRDTIRSLKHRMTAVNDEHLLSQSAIFLQDCESQWLKLDSDLQSLEGLSQELQEYFCDNMKLEEILKIFAEFLNKIVVYRKENEQRKLNEEKLARRKLENESRNGSKRSKHRSFSMDKSNDKKDSGVGEEVCMIDRLLEEIRKGGHKLKPLQHAAQKNSLHAQATKLS